MEQMKQIQLPIELPTDYIKDSSYLISAATGYELGKNGDHRLLSLNIDHENAYIRIYEAVSGTDRYPPGRMMCVHLSSEEFEKMITIYQARVARQQEEEQTTTSKQVTDDFDPFLTPDDLP